MQCLKILSDLINSNFLSLKPKVKTIEAWYYIVFIMDVNADTTIPKKEKEKKTSAHSKKCFVNNEQGNIENDAILLIDNGNDLHKILIGETMDIYDNIMMT